MECSTQHSKWTDFEDFLKKRGIPETTIAELKNEKIDPDVIIVMDDKQLNHYFPQYGDRLAIIDFCRRKQIVKSKRKLSIVEQFNAKVMTLDVSCQGQENCIDDHSPSLAFLNNVEENASPIKETPKSNHVRPTRQIFFGWCMVKPSGFKVQVRRRQGGGTKKPTVLKTSKKGELLELGKKLFFPDGKSLYKGSLDKFDIDICDYQMNSIDNNVSVGEMFAITKLSHLRLYFTTSPKDPLSMNVDDEEEKDDKDSALEVSDNEYPFHHDDCIGQLDNEVKRKPIENIEAVSEDSLVILVAHRGQIFQDLLNSFKFLSTDCHRLSVKVVLQGGEIEKADLGEGFRDCLSEFWETFYQKFTMGACYKVPILRHDFSEAEWQSIGKVLVRGWISEKYFPIGLAPAFIEQCIFGEHSDILESFSMFVSPSERETMNICLNNYSKVDSDDLYDLLHEYKCNTFPSALNISKVLHEIAHQEIIQKPAFVINLWRFYMRNMMTKEQLKEIYERLQPSPKNILKALSSSYTTPEQERVFNFLKKYVRESNESTLKSLLRFCTGFDLLIVKTIDVTYNLTRGYKRSPVSHVCSCILELPVSYSSFVDFRLEFNRLLSSKVWVMDF